MADKDNQDKLPNPSKQVTDGPVTVHLDRDPNDPRRVPPAKPNVSDLNKEDPEKKPEFQNPV